MPETGPCGVQGAGFRLDGGPDASCIMTAVTQGCSLGHSSAAEDRIQQALSEEAEKAKIQIDKVRHDALIDAFKGPNRYVVYFGKIRTEPDGQILVKIGSSKDLKVRSETLADEFGSMSIFKVFDCLTNEMFERFLQKHPMIAPFLFKDVIHNGRRSNEVFKVQHDFIETMMLIAKKSLKKFQTVASAEHEIVLERLKVQKHQTR